MEYQSHSLYNVQYILELAIKYCKVRKIKKNCKRIILCNLSYFIIKLYQEITG